MQKAVHGAAIMCWKALLSAYATGRRRVAVAWVLILVPYAATNGQEAVTFSSPSQLSPGSTAILALVTPASITLTVDTTEQTVQLVSGQVGVTISSTQHGQFYPIVISDGAFETGPLDYYGLHLTGARIACPEGKADVDYVSGLISLQIECVATAMNSIPGDLPAVAYASGRLVNLNTVSVRMDGEVTTTESIPTLSGGAVAATAVGLMIAAWFLLERRRRRSSELAS